MRRGPSALRPPTKVLLADWAKLLSGVEKSNQVAGDRQALDHAIHGPDRKGQGVQNLVGVGSRLIQVAVMPAFIHCSVTEPVHGGGEPFDSSGTAARSPMPPHG